MKQKLQFAIGALVLALFGVWIYWAQLGVRSTTFAGPAFDSRDIGDTTTVFKEFSSHLEQIGFQGSESPSEFDSWAGLHSAGAHRIWFVKYESNKSKTFVYVDLEKTAVRTSIKWEVFGTHHKAQLAEQDAYRLALALDDWFAARKESNELPQKLRDEKRQWFNKGLAKNEES